MPEKIKKIKNPFLLPWKPVIDLCENNKDSEFVKITPNLITAFRIFLTCPLYLLLLGTLQNKSIIQGIGFLVLFFLVGTSDAADGEIARKTNNITIFGKLFDALADKLFFGSIFLAEGNYLLEIGFLNQVEILLGVLLISCEIVLMILGIAGLIISKYRETKLGANDFGKFKFPSECLLVFGVLVIILIGNVFHINIFPFLHFWILILLSVCIIFALSSIIQHIKDLNLHSNLHSPANI